MMRNAFVLSFWALATLTTPSSADPRQDTLSAISRCASLPDDRIFLDCIYGAAQPLRARLGLAPAPASQQRLVPPAGRVLAQTSLSGAAAPAAPQTSGILGMFKSDGLHMAAYSFDKGGLFTVTLSDGTVWRQDAADSNFAHFGGKASNYSVTLAARGSGKSRMTVRGEGGPYLVERVR
jgi:hypothetical protein